jgi:hypothetical protein
MNPLYQKLSPSTRARYTEAELDTHLRAVLKKRVQKTFNDALQPVLFRMEVSRTIANLLADPDFIRDTYTKAMQTDGRQLP